MWWFETCMCFGGVWNPETRSNQRWDSNAIDTYTQCNPGAYNSTPARGLRFYALQRLFYYWVGQMKEYREERESSDSKVVHHALVSVYELHLHRIQWWAGLYLFFMFGKRIVKAKLKRHLLNLKNLHDLLLRNTKGVILKNVSVIVVVSAWKSVGFSVFFCVVQKKDLYMQRHRTTWMKEIDGILI